MRRQENFSTFDLQTFRDQPDKDRCTVHFLDGASRAMILSCLRYAKFFSRWHVNDEASLGELSGLEIDEIEGLVGEAHLGVIMGCDTSLITDELAGIRAELSGILATLADTGATLDTGLAELVEVIGIACTGNSSCSCGCGGGGFVTEPSPGGVVGCAVPGGFGSIEEYREYACSYSHWATAKMVLAFHAFLNLPVFFKSDVESATAERRLTLSETYSKVNGHLSSTLDDLVWQNMTTAERTSLITFYADRMYRYTSDVIIRVPGTSTFQEVQEDWWIHPILPALQWATTNDTLAQNEMYNFVSATGTDIQLILRDWLDDAIVLGVSYGNEVTELLEQGLKPIVSMGLSNLRFVNSPAVQNYGDDSCTGDGPCPPNGCREYSVQLGQDNGDYTFDSEPFGLYHQVRITSDNTFDIDELSHAGLVPTGSIFAYTVWSNQTVVYEDDVPWVGFQNTVTEVRFVSSSPFVVGLTINCGGV